MVLNANVCFLLIFIPLHRDMYKIEWIENVANREEFDGDDDAGVYNPVVLPWKNR